MSAAFVADHDGGHELSGAGGFYTISFLEKDGTVFFD
jgi:hypothetical protein